jgi:1-aminocyclopropane-1-carboxylate deaminase/D-cysteine desulfhydrase-like pyridoxal-dependent ACC family enzyme
MTGLAFGGNKTRKLEFVLAEAQAHGARTLITGGGIQSNHCRQTAAAAARFGFDCILILSGGPPTNPSGNFLLDQLLGAEVVWAPRPERERVMQETFDKAWADGRRPYLIPIGASNNLGAASYAFAIQEMLEQLSGSSGLEYPNWVVMASSSGGTQAGMALGARIFGYTGKILGIGIDEEQDVLQRIVADLANLTADYLGEKINFTPGDIEVNADYLGDGYGVMGELEREAIHMFATCEGLLLDPVYTGRAAAGMIDLIRKGFFSKQDTLLFWHTGGATALFADQYGSVV